MLRTRTTATRAGLALTLAGLAATALTAAPATSYAAVPAAGTSPAAAGDVADSIWRDTLPPGRWPHLGTYSFSRAGRHTGALSGSCVPAIPAGTARVTARYAPPEDSAGRAAQTVVELGTRAAARDAARAIATAVPKCPRGKDTRVFAMKTGASTSWLWSTITVEPGEEEGWFGYIGVGYQGTRLTVTYYGHGGQDSNFPVGTFEKLTRYATARLG